eukprot:871313-Pelagomonas_calceolata.AAC.10
MAASEQGLLVFSPLPITLGTPKALCATMRGMSSTFGDGWSIFMAERMRHPVKLSVLWRMVQSVEKSAHKGVGAKSSQQQRMGPPQGVLSYAPHFL